MRLFEVEKMAKKMVVVPLVVAMSGCTGLSGVRSDGSATAGNDTNVVTYTATRPDGSKVSATYASGKQTIADGIEFEEVSPDGTKVRFRLKHAESGEHDNKAAIGAAGKALDLANKVVGAGGLVAP